MSSAIEQGAGRAACAYPARFLSAVARVLADEGGYVHDPADPGGETKFGISRRRYPAVDIAHLTREQAIAIYFRDYWSRYRYGELPSAVAAKVFDLAVNIGPAEAVRCLQRALRACGHQVADDAVMGKVTLAAACAASAEPLAAALRSEAAGYYRTLAEQSAQARAFLQGWLERAYE